MAYVEGFTVHDADSHVMELPGTVERYAAPWAREALAARLKRREGEDWSRKLVALHEASEFRAGFEANLMTRKSFEAMGAFRSEDRPSALDLLGFSSQLMFTTAGLALFPIEQDDPRLALEGARAHNRMMSDFCAVDRRLLATAYVPLVDLEAAPTIAEEAIALGCKGFMIPSQTPRDHSPSHKALDRLWAIAQEAGLPILFHVGGEKKIEAAYLQNGGPEVLDFHGGAENFTSVSFMTIPLSIWQTLSVLVVDGVFDRFPRLQFGAIELGASWVPSLMKFLDSAALAFGKEDRLRTLSDRPSEILKRQFFATPYPHEDVAWIMETAGEDVCLFSSDYPHVEGGRNPMKRFSENLAGVSDSARRRFYRDNFIAMMGRGLEACLPDRQAVA